jgi:hypothetical protein
MGGLKSFHSVKMMVVQLSTITVPYITPLSFKMCTHYIASQYCFNYYYETTIALPLLPLACRLLFDNLICYCW